MNDLNKNRTNTAPPPASRRPFLMSVARTCVTACCVAAITVVAVADTGSPPPPVMVPGAQVSITKVHVRTFWASVLPAYEAWLCQGSCPNCYPAFVLFLATYPASGAERAAYVQLYLQLYPVTPNVAE